MITIHKFSLYLDTEIKVTEGFKILSIQNQDNTAMVWVQLDTEKKPVTARIISFGTGCDMEKLEEFSEHQFLGTVQLGMFVFHYYLVESKGDNNA